MTTTDTRPPAPEPATLTFGAYALRVVERLRHRGVKSADEVARWLRLWAAPLSLFELHELRATHGVQLADLLAQSHLAPKSQIHVLGYVHQVLAEAVAEGLLDRDPFAPCRRTWPKNRDSVRFGARDQHIFTPAEAVRICCDDAITPERRVVYALKAFCGLRHGEVARLTWLDYERTEPLCRLHIRITKSDKPRLVPVHPMMARILDAWRPRWARFYGRPLSQPHPFPGDLLVPTRRLRARGASTAQHDFLRDLKRLGLRPRRGHDLRRTFISFAQECGANRDLLRHITHGRPQAVLDQYSSFSWAALCGEILKIRWPEYDGRQLCLPGFPTGTAAVSPAGVEPAAGGLKVPSPSSRTLTKPSTLRRARLRGLAAVRVASTALALGQVDAARAALEHAVAELDGYRRRGAADDDAA